MQVEPVKVTDSCKNFTFTCESRDWCSPCREPATMNLNQTELTGYKYVRGQVEDEAMHLRMCQVHWEKNAKQREYHKSGLCSMCGKEPATENVRCSLAPLCGLCYE